MIKFNTHVIKFFLHGFRDSGEWYFYVVFYKSVSMGANYE